MSQTLGVHDLDFVLWRFRASHNLLCAENEMKIDESINLYYKSTGWLEALGDKNPSLCKLKSMHVQKNWLNPSISCDEPDTLSQEILSVWEDR